MTYWLRKPDSLPVPCTSTCLRANRSCPGSILSVVAYAQSVLKEAVTNLAHTVTPGSFTEQILGQFWNWAEYVLKAKASTDAERLFFLRILEISNQLASARTALPAHD